MTVLICVLVMAPLQGACFGGANTFSQYVFLFSFIQDNVTGVAKRASSYSDPIPFITTTTTTTATATIFLLSISTKCCSGGSLKPQRPTTAHHPTII